MPRPQLRLIIGGKKESPVWKWEPVDFASLAVLGSIVTVGGTILRKAIQGRL